MDPVRDGVRDLSQLSFVLAKLLFRGLALVNVCEQDAPSNDPIVGVPDKLRIVMKPAVSTIGTAKPVIQLVWLASLYCVA